MKTNLLYTVIQDYTGVEPIKDSVFKPMKAALKQHVEINHPDKKVEYSEPYVFIVPDTGRKVWKMDVGEVNETTK